MRNYVNPDYYEHHYGIQSYIKIVGGGTNVSDCWVDGEPLLDGKAARVDPDRVSGISETRSNSLAVYVDFRFRI